MQLSACYAACHAKLFKLCTSASEICCGRVRAALHCKGLTCTGVSGTALCTAPAAFSLAVFAQSYTKVLTLALYCSTRGYAEQGAAAHLVQFYPALLQICRRPPLCTQRSVLKTALLSFNIRPVTAQLAGSESHDGYVPQPGIRIVSSTGSHGATHGGMCLRVRV